MGEPNARNSARWWSAIAYGPVLIVFWVNAVWVWNHFHAHSPFLFDSGWFSAIVWRAGIIPRNPPVMGSVPYYWGWHPSLIVSFGSLASYVFPGDRVDWYAIFQGAIYAPLACVVPALVPREARSSVRSALLVAVASLGFAFSGQVLCAITYPHFEIFSSAGVAIMLAGLATGRERLAWAGTAMSIATREDGGYHAGSLLLAVLAVDLLKRPFPIPRRRVLVMTGVAFAATIVMLVVQKTCFVSVNAFEIYLVGKPPFAHVSAELLAQRLAYFATHCGFIWVPVVAAGALAVVRRDARYLLGWVALVPWFLLNITAKQELKAAFSVYIGFPFVAGILWPAVYARTRAGNGWRSPVVIAGAIGLASTAALLVTDTENVIDVFRSGSFFRSKNASGMRALARTLREHRFGNERFDEGMASWAMEGAREGSVITDAERESEVRVGDSLAFISDQRGLELMPHTPFSRCGQVASTVAFLCLREGGALPDDILVRRSPFLAAARVDGRIPEGEHDIHVPPGPAELRAYGPYIHVRAGRYLATWTLAFDRCPLDARPPFARVDVARGLDETIAARDVAATESKVTLSFDAPADRPDALWELRTFSGSCGFTVTDLDLRARE